jgi:branched-chain amino acid transport system permease protein
MNYLLHLIIYLNIYVIEAMSLNIVMGYCGLMSLAHAGYFAIGGYAYAILATRFGLGFIPAILVGAILSAVLSLAVSIPSWRFKGDSFVITSLAMQSLLFSLLYNWTQPNEPIGTWKNLTNGPFGVPGIPKPAILGIKFDTIGGIAILSVILSILCGIICWRLLGSPWGRLLRSIRDDELAARGIGKNVRLAKIQAFAISCALVAIAGALYSTYVSYIDPAAASLDESILMLAMVLVGGMGNFRGPLVGAAVLLLIPEILRFAQIPGAVSANVRLLAYGLLIALMMHVRPQGLAGEYKIE